MSNLYITLISFGNIFWIGISVVVSHIDFLFPCRQRLATAAIVVRFDVLSSQMLIWSIFASFDLILWASYFASFRSLQNIVPERFCFDVLLLNLACVLSIMVTLPNCCCRQAVVVACLVFWLAKNVFAFACIVYWTCWCWTASVLLLDNFISVCEFIACFAIADGNLKWLVCLSS